MRGNDAVERRKHFNSIFGNIEVEKEEAEEEQEDEEALSLCDLPTNEENQSRKETPKTIEFQEEFNFCSWGDSVSKESEMCVADEVFFQGKILPLRHSVSSESGLITKLQSDSRTTSRCISRSKSMDHCYSVGFTSASSRSNSINSLQSSSSGSSATTASKNKPRPKIRNQFQYSHPSPKPQIRSSNIKNANTGNCNRKSTLWSFFRVGLVTNPEIAIQDLKFGSSNKNSSSTNSFGSRNSTSSISNTSSNSNCKIKADKKQRQQKFFNKNGVFFSGCKCSSNAVVGTIPSRVAAHVIRRSASVNDAHADEEELLKKRTTTKHQQAGKQALSRRRTFEWLKQVSLEAAAVN